MAWTDGVDGKPETVMRSFGLRIRILACPGEGATNPPRRFIAVRMPDNIPRAQNLRERDAL